MGNKLWETENMNVYERNQELFQIHLMEQYKLYVEMADKISERRNLTNGFFLTLNTLFITILGFLFEKVNQLTSNFGGYLYIFIGLLLCLMWWLILKSYRDINSAKFKVIGQLEEKLPSSPYWLAEWEELGQGRKLRKYFPLSHLEKFVPLIFSILYLSFILFI
jgi:hypothetical protein